ncbi:MAG: TIGR02221 family CRISPR-associated protein, partial [Rhodospirillales bacterium]|nr:TIGR02221 family CRISPR-associated protein [Rhodospirillales bacterium]
VEPLMRRAIGRDVAPRLIPFGRDAEQQYEILDDMEGVLQAGKASFDLTHGFRHLGMVGFMSAFMLERVRKLNVEGLWYGALDMSDRETGITPVLRLDGLMRVRRWVDALDRFDANGDYGVFAPLLIEDGVPADKARFLERAAFHERTLNLSGAAQEIRNFAPLLNAPLAGASELFRKPLRERIDWARATGLAEQQRRLAFKHLERRDFIRTAIFGWEALTTRECDRRGFTASDYSLGRKPAIDAFEDEIGSDRQHPEREAFYSLRTMRNALVHGNPPNSSRYRSLLRDPDRLQRALEDALRTLLDDGGA